MEYIAVTLITISVATFVVYKVANNIFNMQLKPRPIILCACCATLISLVLPRVVVGYAGVLGTLGFLALFAIIFAYYIAYYDSSREFSNAATEVPTSLMDGVIDPSFGRPQHQQSEVIVSQPIKIEKIEKTIPSQDTVDAELTQSEEGVVAVAVEGAVLRELLNTGFISDEPEYPPVPEAEKWETTDDMDELLEYAFMEKERMNYNSALNAFRKVLRLYPDSDAVPYIIVEVGNILKLKGAYDDAIQVFSEGRNCPAINETLEMEFVNTVAFLRIVKNTLLKHRLGFVPFNQIPPSVYGEIDTEFREWRNLA